MKKCFLAVFALLSSTVWVWSQANVGIGTATPNKGVLEIVGDATYSNLSAVSNTGTQGMSLNFSELGFNMYRANGLKQFGSGYAGAINFSGGKIRMYVSETSEAAGAVPGNLFGNSAALTIDNNRNVGIGSEFPSNFPASIGSQLLVSKISNDFNVPQMTVYSGTNVGDGKVAIHMRVGSFGTPARLWRLESTNNSVLADERFNITNTSGGTIVSVAGNNRVAIGSPTKFATGYMLSVRGKIICEEVRVQLNNDWPDYVFDPAYQRPDLDALEKQVKLNRHLPGIPSAQTLGQAGGVHVGDMQIRLLEKLEELYLYVFELNRENDLLLERLQKLEQKNKPRRGRK